MQSELRVVDIFTRIQILHDVFRLNIYDGQFGIFSAVVLAAANDGHLKQFETNFSCQISNGHK